MSSMADLTESKKAELKDAYLTDASLTLRRLSDLSESLCGISVSVEVLKIISWTDGWGVIKKRQQLGKEGEPLDVADEADDLRRILYARMMDPDMEIGVRDMADLVRTWDTVRAVSPRKVSGKAARQQVIDSTRAGLVAVAELIEKRANENPPS